MTDSGYVVQLDELALLMLRYYRELTATEPQSTPDGEEGHLEWAREREAVRIMLGMQLSRLALDQLKHQP